MPLANVASSPSRADSLTRLLRFKPRPLRMDAVRRSELSTKSPTDDPAFLATYRRLSTEQQRHVRDIVSFLAEAARR